MDRKIVQKAARITGGDAVLLPPCWDYALIGYVALRRMPGNTRVMVGVYDYHLAIEKIPEYKGGRPYDAEDHLLDDQREIRKKMGVEPLTVLTK